MRRQRAAWTGVAVVALGAYFWPTAARSSSRLDVVVIGDGAVVSAGDELGRQFRERGMRVELVTDVDPCAQDGLRDAASGAHAVVVSFTAATADRCGGALVDAIARLDDPIVVAQDHDGVPWTVDATRLVPPGESVRLGCEWWEPPAPAGAIANCEADGAITVRDDSGELTVAGRDRFARVVAGSVG